MNKQIEQAIQRTRAYPYVDGTYDLKLGLTLLLISAYNFLPTIASTAGAIFLFILALILIGLGPWLIDRLIRAIKERHTYRRSGYAEAPKKTSQYPPDTMMLFAVLGFLAFSVLYSAMEGIFTSRWLPLLPALILAVIVFLAGVRASLRRYILLAFVCLLVGFILAWGGIGSGYSANLYLAGMGGIFLAEGIFTFLNYLKNTPLPQEPADEQ